MNRTINIEIDVKGSTQTQEIMDDFSGMNFVVCKSTLTNKNTVAIQMAFMDIKETIDKIKQNKTAETDSEETVVEIGKNSAGTKIIKDK